MSPRLRLALFLAGAALLALLLSRIGPAALAGDIARTGWWLLPMTLLYLPIYALNTRTWQLILDEGLPPREPHPHQRPPFHHLLALTVSGFAINYLTPVVSLGGEPYRAAAIAPRVGAGKAAGSVVVFTILHALGILFLWVSAIIAALITLRPSIPATLALLALGCIIVALAVFLFNRLRRGGILATVALLRRLPLLRRQAERLEGRTETLEALELQLTRFYRHDRRRFFQALTLEFLAYTLTTLEYWFIFLSLDLPLGPGDAFLVGAAYSLLRNLLFFIPFELGTREAGLYALMALVAGDGGSGVAAGIATRIREVVWIAVGLLLLWAYTPTPADHAGGV
jgi:uncharacterized protein (TIRG00374 family)